MILAGFDHEILGFKWISGMYGTVGVVAVWYERDKYWQAYIGPALGHSESQDIIRIAEWGGKLQAEEAFGFFPELEKRSYKTIKNS